MRRSIASFLLLFALAGSVLPLAAQDLAARAHACCLRQSAHHCHESASKQELPVVREVGCCPRNSSRAVRTSVAGNPEPRLRAAVAPASNFLASDVRIPGPESKFPSSQSTRAPPQFSFFT